MVIDYGNYYKMFLVLCIILALSIIIQRDRLFVPQEIDMKNFMILHYGFERPTPEEMGAWNKWFESIADIQVERGHFPGGRGLSGKPLYHKGFRHTCLR